MGNGNSTRWANHTRKALVEECQILDVAQAIKQWRREHPGEPVPEYFSPGVGTQMRDGTIKDVRSTHVNLIAVPSNLGRGEYYVAECPRCKRHCRKLYSYRKTRFVCRLCIPAGYLSQLSVPTLLEQAHKAVGALHAASNAPPQKRKRLLKRALTIMAAFDDAMQPTLEDARQKWERYQRRDQN